MTVLNARLALIGELVKWRIRAFLDLLKRSKIFDWSGPFYFTPHQSEMDVKMWKNVDVIHGELDPDWNRKQDKECKEVELKEKLF